MLKVFFVGWILLLLLACLAVSGVLVYTAMRRRRAAREELLLRRSVGEVVRFVVGEEEPKSLPAERCVERSRSLVRLISRLYGALYGINPAPLMRLVQRYGLDRRLLRRAHRLRGVMRAVWLKRLSDLPPSQDALLACGDFDEDRSREVRFAVLLIRLCAEPQTALFRIAHFDSPLRTCEVGEILHHLRRGLLPIAYHPLLESENGNLRRLGLAIVRQFSIEEADARLWCMVAEEGDRELAAASLYTLLTLHRPLRRRPLLGYLARLNEEERRAVMRRLAREGYGAAQVQRLLGRERAGGYGRLVESYKASLVWS